MDRSSRQKVNKEIADLKENLDQMDLTDIYIEHSSKAAEYTFLSSSHGTFSKIDNVLGNKASLNKFKKTEIISSIFSNHSAMKLEINYKKKSGKGTNMYRLNNMLLKNHRINEEIKGEIKKYLETNENENTTYQNLWDAAKVVLRGKFTAIEAYLKKQENSQTI